MLISDELPTGEELEPVYPLVAAAQASGDIAPHHARIVTRTIGRLPLTVQAAHATEVEAFLVEQARQFAAEQLSKLAQRLSESLDPEGVLADEQHRHRLRDFTCIADRMGRPGSTAS